MKEINLTLTTAEGNLILEALGELPFVKVYGLIGKIKDQADRQFSEEKAEPNIKEVAHAQG